MDSKIPTSVLTSAFPDHTAVFGWVLLGLTVGWIVRSARADTDRPLVSWLWWLLLAGVIAAFRWPLIWLPHELYPDESQLLAGALTLRHDPMFWRSVDGGTAGPLDFYVLLPAAFFPGVTGFAIARMTAVALIVGGLAAVGETLALIADRTVARGAVLPLLGFAAFTTSPEFIPYSTEMLPAFLLALGTFGLVRQSVRPSRTGLFLTAFLLGAIPFSKLQAAPIAFATGLLLLRQEFNAGRRRDLVPAIVAALLPTVVALAAVTLAGQAQDMLIPYFLQNTIYAEGGRQSVGLVVRQLWEQSMTNGYLALWLAGAAVVVVAGAMRSGKAPIPLRRAGIMGALLFAITLGCVLAPGRPYHHYLNFLILPLGLLAGVALAVWMAPTGPRRLGRPRVVLGIFLGCGLVPQIGLRVSDRPDPYADYNHVATAPGPAHLLLAEKVRAWAGPDAALGLWGWRSSLYVETGLRQASREAHTEFLFVTGPWQHYYLRRYLGDLAASRPPVFVDAVGPGNFRFQDRRWGHEVFPFLRDWVDRNYRLAGDGDGVRVYVRRDLPSSGAN